MTSSEGFGAPSRRTCPPSWPAPVPHGDQPPRRRTGPALILRERLRADRAALGDVGRPASRTARPAAFRAADDLVVGALAPDILVGRDRGQDRDADRRGEGLRLAGAVVLVDDQAAYADIAAELAEIFDRRADIVGDIERLQIVGSDDDHFLAHVARDRQAETPADHVA